jgi:hypothetical protein
MPFWNVAETLQWNALGRVTSPTFPLRGGSYYVETVSRMSGLYTAATNPTSTQVTVIGTITYRFMTTPVAANDIQLGGSAEATLLSLIAVLNGTAAVGAAGASNDAFTGTVTPNATAAAAARSATELANHSVTIYSLVAGTAGNLTSTSTVTSATWTAATLAITSTTIDLKRQSPDGSYKAMITQITLSVGSQPAAPITTFLVLPPGQYEWIIAVCPSSDLTITRIPTQVE